MRKFIHFCSSVFLAVTGQGYLTDFSRYLPGKREYKWLLRLIFEFQIIYSIEHLNF